MGSKGDPATTVRLLWRHAMRADELTRPGPRQRITVDQAVDTAIALADADGLPAVSMRSVATRLGVGTMSLYTYVASREQLQLLMVDQVWGWTHLPRHPRSADARLRQVARVTYDEHLRHPWLDAAAGPRPGLGPHTMDLYEWQLTALAGLGFDDVELDQAVTLLTGFATQAARIARAHADNGGDTQWWDAAGPALAEFMTRSPHPLAERVGTVSGNTYQASRDPDLELEFGLARIIRGLLGHRVDGSSGSAQDLVTRGVRVQAAVRGSEHQ